METFLMAQGDPIAESCIQVPISSRKERFLDVGIYLDLLLKILDVIHGQIQHVGSVGLLQSSTITGRITTGRQFIYRGLFCSIL